MASASALSGAAGVDHLSGHVRVPGTGTWPDLTLTLRGWRVLLHILGSAGLGAWMDSGRDGAGGVTAATGEVVIDVSALRMSYDGFDAVRGIDLQVRRGEVFAFLGPNGAGKTTTVEILEGFRAASGGTVRVLGED